MKIEDIPFHVPMIGEEEIRAISETVRSTWITTGPACRDFEERFAEFVGAKHAVAVSSGTAALHLALKTAGIGEGDEVITTPYTFVATSEAILYLGAKPVFVDIDPRTLNIDPGLVEDAITDRTRAILPVHIAGRPCDMKAILDLARRHGLEVVDDAAHSLPAWHGDRMIGSLGTATAFSFYATKNLTTGEGGMITTDRDDLAESMRVLRLHGISGDAWKRYSKGGNWYYEVVDNGFKYNLTDIQAAMGRVQLEKLEGMHDIRLRHQRMYREGLEGLPLVLPPEDDPVCRSAHHLFIVRLDPRRTEWSRNDLIDALQQEKISCSVHFIPVHLHPYYEGLGYRSGMYPNAEAAFEQAVSIPFYPAMPDGSVERLLETLHRLLGEKTR